ncbi:Histone transcription regulator 3 [Balamuthia mandrillaris]
MGGVNPQTALTHAALLSVPLCFLLFYFQANVIFLWHPALMLLAFTLMSEGVLVSKYLKSDQRVYLATVHYYLQCGSLCCALLAFMAVLLAKLKEGEPHFQSWHSWIGLFTLFGASLQAAWGFRMRYLPRVTLSALQQLLRLQSVHRRWGSFIYLCSVLSICFGLFVMFGGTTTPTTITEQGEEEEGMVMMEDEAEEGEEGDEAENDGRKEHVKDKQKEKEEKERAEDGGSEAIAWLLSILVVGLALHVFSYVPKKTIRRLDEEMGLLTA